MGEELDNLDPYREALEACRRAEDSSIALDKLTFYEKLKGEDLPVLLGALAVATEQNQRALGRLLADMKFEDMPELPEAINPMEATFAEAALEHARADAEYFDEDFRMRATEGINLWTVAKEIIEAVPAAKPAEEEPAQARGPKH